MYNFQFLKQNYEFRRAYKKGECYVCPYFVLYIVKGRRDAVRMGITVGKKVGTAVKRNRAKRVLRAAFNENFCKLTNGFDYVFVARTRILTVKSTVVGNALLEILSKQDRQ